MLSPSQKLLGPVSLTACRMVFTTSSTLQQPKTQIKGISWGWSPRALVVVASLCSPPSSTYNGCYLCISQLKLCFVLDLTVFMLSHSSYRDCFPLHLFALLESGVVSLTGLILQTWLPSSNSIVRLAFMYNIGDNISENIVLWPRAYYIPLVLNN